MQATGNLESNPPDQTLFRIGEVSRLTATKPFVLRYWESEFPMLQPVKSPKGHRLYRREDIDTVFVIKRLLYDEGFTIAGARRHLLDMPVGTNRPNGVADHAEGNGSSHSPEDSQGRSTEPSANAPVHYAQPAGLTLTRKTLLDLRDSLRSLLTALESE